jgi:hypothetical protein
MQFINVVSIADDEHSVEVLSNDRIKYSLTDKTSRRTAVVSAVKIEAYWFIIDNGVLTDQVLPPDFSMIADYCLAKYIETDGQKADKLCKEISKITSQPLDLDKERQTNSFAGRAWK